MNDFIDELAVSLLWQALPLGLGLILAVVVGVLLLKGNRIWPAVGVLPVLLAGAGALPLAAWTWFSWDTGAGEELSASAWLVATARVTSAMLVVPVWGVYGLFLGAEGARRPDRRWGFALAVAALVAVLMAVANHGAIVAENPPAGWVRVIGYGCCALPVLAAVLAGGRTDNPTAGDAAVSAGLGYGVVVAVWEGAARGLNDLIMCMTLPGVELAKREILVETLRAHVSQDTTWQAAVLALAVAVGLTASAAGYRRGNGVRLALGLLLWLAALPVLWLGADISAERMIQVGLALP